MKGTLVIKYIKASGQDFFLHAEKVSDICKKLKKQKVLEICINRNHTNRGLPVHESTSFKFKPPYSSGNSIQVELGHDHSFYHLFLF